MAANDSRAAARALQHLQALALTCTCLLAASAVPIRASTTAGNVAAFYYPWYGSDALDGTTLHWRTSAEAVSSAFVPARGEYSSADPTILAAHMNDLRDAGVETLIVSWWGEGSVEDRRLPLVVDAAHKHGLGVALHVEPYAGRTPITVEADVRRIRPYGIDDFYVYDSSTYDDAQWSAVNDRLQYVRLFAHTSRPGKAQSGGFDGLYTYDVLVYDGRGFKRMCHQARALGLVCAPSVGPGFDARVATGENRVQPRRDGRRYDSMWRSALRARADIVTVTSYNEWHEGTQIEPARAAYDGAYGQFGARAERAYLDRTAFWAALFRSAMTPLGPSRS
jgi:hypothetical protein